MGKLLEFLKEKSTNKTNKLATKVFYARGKIMDGFGGC